MMDEATHKVNDSKLDSNRKTNKEFKFKENMIINQNSKITKEKYNNIYTHNGTNLQGIERV
jgi:hypothetical protein